MFKNFFIYYILDKEQNILYRNKNISNNKNLKAPNILNIFKLIYKKLKVFLFDFSFFLFTFFLQSYV